jgi:hypothetical protein
LTVLGRSASPLDAILVRDEASETLAAAFATAWSPDRRAAVRSMATDQPSAHLLSTLQRVFPQLVCLALDPLHLAFAYEYCHGGRRTPGSRALRRILAKCWRRNPTLTQSHWGQFYTGTPTSQVASALQRNYVSQVAEHSMPLPHAECLLRVLDTTTPWLHPIDFLQAMAALSAVFRGEIETARVKRGTSLSRVLTFACSPDRVGWLFNNLRLLHSVSDVEAAWIATGTTANEVSPAGFCLRPLHDFIISLTT